MDGAIALKKSETGNCLRGSPFRVSGVTHGITELKLGRDPHVRLPFSLQSFTVHLREATHL